MFCLLQMYDKDTFFKFLNPQAPTTEALVQPLKTPKCAAAVARNAQGVASYFTFRLLNRRAPKND
jgi:hypothetical protein